MRISSYAVARPAYYDRNAASSLASYNAIVAPHSLTTRWTTTVAAGTKLLIEQAYVEIYRSTAPTVQGIYQAQVYVQSQIIISALSINIAVGTYVNQPIAGAITIYAGESVQGATSDTSTGGTVSYNANYKGTLFAA